MNKTLQKILICPHCKSSDAYNFSSTRVECLSCTQAYPVIDEKICFLNMSHKSINDLPPKKPGKGSFWRLNNWEFNKYLAESLSSKEIVLEVGCGRGYFRSLFGENYIGTDIDLNKKADFICDLTKQNYLRDESVDIVLLNNVLEHVYKYSELLKVCINSLKKNGKLLITVPYSAILHQMPNDYFRFSHYSLKKLLEQNGMSIIQFEAVYQPITQLRRSLNRVMLSLVDNQRNKLAKIFINLMKINLKIALKVSNGFYPIGNLSLLDGKLDVSDNHLNSPLGYQIIAEKQ